jgi:hypothetical protein
MVNKHRNLVILLVIFIVCVSPLELIKVRALALSEAFSATLDPKGGNIGIKKVGSEDWTAVTEATLVGTGDQIGTGTDGTATISIPGSLTVDVTSGSIVQVEQLEMRDSEPGLIFGLSTLTGIIQVNAATLKPVDKIYFLTPTTLATTTNAEFVQIVNSDLSTAVIASSGSVTVIAPDGDHVANGDTAVLVSGVSIPEGATDVPDDILKNATTTEINDGVTPETVDVFKNLLSQLLQHNTVYSTNIVRDIVSLPDIDDTADLAKAISETQAEIDKIAADDVKTTANTQAQHIPSAPNASNLGLAKRGNVDGQALTAQSKRDRLRISILRSRIIRIIRLQLGKRPLTGDTAAIREYAVKLAQARLLVSVVRRANLARLEQILRSLTNTGNPDDTTGNGTGQGQGTGVGRNPGPVVRFSGTGGAQCTVTVTTDVNERSLDTGAVVGTAPAGSSFTVIGTNNNGWVTTGNFSIARNFTTASAGCPQ